MANPIDFPQSNRDLLKPPDMEDKQCGSLRIMDTTYEGYPAMVSCWKFSPQELAYIAEHGHVWVEVVGAGHPPIAVFADKLESQTPA